MKNVLAALGFASLVPFNALAGVSVSVNIGWAAPPPLVVVSPGVQVVEDYDEEVFVVDGWYWVERDGIWYHSRDHHGGWVVVEREHVPVWLVNHPRGHYRHWKHEMKEEAREERHEEKREEKHEEHKEKKHGKH